MEQPEKIIVFRKFQNSFDASIVKSKLDAYGVLCFLTEENLANLYPGQNFMIFTIRLHLFAKDEERARQILDESNLILNDSITTCPNCHSNTVEHAFPKQQSERLFSILRVLSFGIFFPKQKVYQCLECGYEFDTL